jgi:ribose transport system permease protein
MSELVLSTRRRATLLPDFRRHRGLIVAIAVFVVLFLAVDAITPGAFSYFEIHFMSAGGATLALAAMGQTIVILTGGFDLSAGAVVSLVNVVLASAMGTSPLSQIAFFAVALAVGALVGAFNGFFVAFVRMQSIVVTLSTMFIAQGAPGDGEAGRNDRPRIRRLLQRRCHPESAARAAGRAAGRGPRLAPSQEFAPRRRALCGGQR